MPDRFDTGDRYAPPDDWLVKRALQKRGAPAVPTPAGAINPLVGNPRMSDRGDFPHRLMLDPETQSFAPELLAIPDRFPLIAEGTETPKILAGMEVPMGEKARRLYALRLLAESANAPIY